MGGSVFSNSTICFAFSSTSPFQPARSVAMSTRGCRSSEVRSAARQSTRSWCGARSIGRVARSSRICCDADGDAAPHHQAEVNTADGAAASCEVQCPASMLPSVLLGSRASTNPKSAGRVDRSWVPATIRTGVWVPGSGSCRTCGEIRTECIEATRRLSAEGSRGRVRSSSAPERVCGATGSPRIRRWTVVWLGVPRRQAASGITGHDRTGSDV